MPKQKTFNTRSLTRALYEIERPAPKKNYSFSTMKLALALDEICVEQPVKKRTFPPMKQLLNELIEALDSCTFTLPPPQDAPAQTKDLEKRLLEYSDDDYSIQDYYSDRARFQKYAQFNNESLDDDIKIMIMEFEYVSYTPEIAGYLNYKSQTISQMLYHSLAVQ